MGTPLAVPFTAWLVDQRDLAAAVMRGHLPPSTLDVSAGGAHAAGQHAAYTMFATALSSRTPFARWAHQSRDLAHAMLQGLDGSTAASSLVAAARPAPARRGTNRAPGPDFSGVTDVVRTQLNERFATEYGVVHGTDLAVARAGFQEACSRTWMAARLAISGAPLTVDKDRATAALRAPSCHASIVCEATDLSDDDALVVREAVRVLAAGEAERPTGLQTRAEPATETVLPDAPRTPTVQRAHLSLWRP